MSFFKNNKTNTTATTETTATEENTNKGGGLLTTLAVAGGTIIGITAAVVGGRKVYKHFHDADEIIDSDDDFEEEGFDEDDDFVEEPANEASVENFKEVETEVTENPETAKAEEAKADVTVEKASVKAKEAKTEETKKPEPVEAKQAKTDVTKEEATKETETMKYERLIGEAVSKVPYDKPETVDLAFYVRCMGGYLRDINMEDAGNTGRFVIAEQCLAMTNLVSRAIIHIASTNITDLDEYRGVYCDIKRLQREFKASRIMNFTQNPEQCEAKFDESANMVMQNLSLTRSILKLKEAKPTASKTSTGENQTADKVDGETKTTENCFDVFNKEHKESNKAEGETKTSTKASDENKKLMKLIHKCNDELPIRHPERVDICHSIRCMNSYIQKIDKSSLSKDELRELRDECSDMSRSVAKAITNIGGEYYDNIKDVHKAARKINEISKEFIDSDIMDTTINPSSEKKYFNRRVKRSLERLDDTKNDLVLESKNRSAKNTEDETKTSENELPNETQVGNSTVVSDDGKTVTLTAEVSQDSINNVNEVIDIVSRIPNRENPELNDMGYIIRVIGSRIHGITEPETTFIAYDDATNSNKFIDACTDVCSLAGKAICNLANSGKNPLASMQWIDGCKNELIASGIIDNTYDPNAYRSAILKAHGEAMDKLSKMVLNETQVNTTKVTESNNEIIDKINTILGEMNPMVANDFKGLTPEKFIEKIRAIDDLIGRLDKSKRSKSMINIANTNTNIAISAFCDAKCAEIDACDDRTKIVDLSAVVQYIATMKLANIGLTNTTLVSISKAVNASHNKVNEIATKDLAESSDETQADDNSSNETQAEEPLTFTMSEKIQEAVQQSDETAATAAPEPESQAPMSPEASSLAAKLQEVGELMRAKKWSDASEFYKTQLTPYLADDGLSKELREEIMGIKTKATNMMMTQKQLEAKQKAASAKASKKGGKKRRRH